MRLEQITRTAFIVYCAVCLCLSHRVSGRHWLCCN